MSLSAQMADVGNLAVDTGDENETIDVSASATASITSSLYEHVEENGRTYHRYKEGKYYLPNDEVSAQVFETLEGVLRQNSVKKEQNRLDFQHYLCKLMLHDRLYLAPLKEDVTNVLDIGTGTGIWAVDFAQQYPEAQVIGSDLSPIQPEFVPPNLSFEIGDVDDEWLWPSPFSYIHGRLMVFCFRDPVSIFRKAFKALEPGGYFEMQDSCAPLRGIDDSFEGTALAKASKMVYEACSKIGIDVTAPSRYKAMMEEVGFVDVSEIVFKWPFGTWPKGTHYKTMGAWIRKDFSMGIEGMAMKLFTKVLGMTMEAVKAEIADVLKDLHDDHIHAYQDFYVVYGRKPL